MKPSLQSWPTFFERFHFRDSTLLNTKSTILVISSRNLWIDDPPKYFYLSDNRGRPLRIVPSMDNENCPMVIERSAGRWGIPSVLWSHNGIIFFSVKSKNREHRRQVAEAPVKVKTNSIQPALFIMDAYGSELSSVVFSRSSENVA